MWKNILLIAALLLILPPNLIAQESNRSIKVKGESSTIVKPTVAHFFVKVSGTGKSYAESMKNAQDELDKLTVQLNKILPSPIELQVLNIDSKIEGESLEDLYRDGAIVKSMLGIKSESKEPEKITVMSLYFSLDEFTPESIIEFKDKLAETGVYFSTANRPIGYGFENEYGRTTILFGLSNKDDLLAKLTKESYEKAKRDATIMAEATGNKIGQLQKLTCCKNELTGSFVLDSWRESPALTGRELGPVSLDPERLQVTFSSDFIFNIIE